MFELHRFNRESFINLEQMGNSFYRTFEHSQEEEEVVFTSPAKKSFPCTSSARMS